MAMGSVGLQSSIWNNNLKSTLLLIGFPLVILGLFLAIIAASGSPAPMTDTVMISPFIFGGVGIWFLIAYASHQSMINSANGAEPLSRKDNPKIYNMLENMCISRGIKMPQLFIIETDVMNAYATGLNESSYSITLTRGIIEKLDDHELEAVIGHELTHILNKDVRLLVISIIFVGIISFICEMIVRSVLRGATRSRSSNSKGNGAAIIFAIAIAAVGYLLAILIRFAISRRREYLADAGAVELTKRPESMIGALQKISGKSDMKDVNDDMRMMMIDNAKSFMGLFTTHPSIENRIKALKGY